MTTTSRDPLTQILVEFAARVGTNPDLPQRMLALRDAKALRNAADDFARQSRSPGVSNGECVALEIGARRLRNLAAALDVCASSPAPAVQRPLSGGTLTPAQMRVLREITRGGDLDEVAHRLCLSLYTVKTHVRDMKARTGTTTIAHLVAYAIGHGLLPADIALTGRHR